MGPFTTGPVESFEDDATLIGAAARDRSIDGPLGPINVTAFLI
ncbi:MAG: hypothetical protein AAF718_13715 [Pseudomonadota bacterium]